MNKRLRSPGHFISFEGGEGAGKTTLIAKLQAELSKEGYEVVVTREPGGSALGNKIRQWVLTHDEQVSIGQLAELLLFLAARAQHIEELIKPALEAGKIVLCDRFNDSTIAYQGGARNLGIPYVQQLCEQVCAGTIPQVTLYLNIDPEIGLKRRLREDKVEAAPGSLDRIESETLDFHKRVQAAFLLLAQQQPERITVIDATKSIEGVFNDAYRVIKNKME